MSTLTYITLLITTIILLPAAAFSQNPAQRALVTANTTPFIPGTDKPKTRKCGTGNIYQYNAYTIYTIPTENEPGESLFVYPTDKTKRQLCRTKNQKPLHIFDNTSHGGANFFAGLSGDYLFIDQGTGPAYRGLSIYDLRDGKLIFFSTYTDPYLTYGTLTYFETIPARKFFDLRNKCPERGAWKRAGFNTVYQREMTYDIESGEKKALENYRCVAGQ